LNAHGTAISNTIKQVAGGIGTALLVTVMTTSTKSHFQDMVAAGGAAASSMEVMKMEATIQGINDAYLVIIGIGIVGLLLSFFIKRTGQAEEKATAKAVERKTVSEWE
jgi:mannose/fructose/N-acetylgalactosamine-specific phosphotransferase system component IIC